MLFHFQCNIAIILFLYHESPHFQIQERDPIAKFEIKVFNIGIIHNEYARNDSKVGLKSILRRPWCMVSVLVFTIFRTFYFYLLFVKHQHAVCSLEGKPADPSRNMLFINIIVQYGRMMGSVFL